jgi:glycosyltransferase involved in cell wall biosynthesis
MNVLYDYQAFSNQRAGGVSRYFVELFAEFDRMGFDGYEIFAGLYLNTHLKEAQASLKHLHGLPLPEGTRASPVLSAINRLLFTATASPRCADIYHATYFNRLPAPRHARRVVTVFDMTYEKFPQSFRADDPTPARKKSAVARADGIICISEQTRTDLLALLPVDPSRVTVIPLGVRSVLPREVPPPPVSVPFFLHVGNRLGYKNFEVVLRALASAPLAQDPCRIVCFGGEAPDEHDRALLERHQTAARVEFRQGGDAALSELYGTATALVYPSLYEGFGLPPLEAMAAGCPALCSDLPVLRETAGAAATFFQAGDANDLGLCMRRMLDDDAWRREKITAGRKRAAEFAWGACAKKTLDFYAAIHGGRSI